MGFRVAARTILQLGAELISSDSIALYELIKNAFDAGSEKGAVIRVHIAIPHHTVQYLVNELRIAQQNDSQELEKLRRKILSQIDQIPPHTSLPEIRHRARLAQSFGEIIEVLECANRIQVEDSGEGMSLNDLNDVYLTIGTRSRLQQKKALYQMQHSAKEAVGSLKPVLGEKGVGRLSAMRLGRKLRVVTSKAGETRANVLEIDWDLFSHESDALLEEIEIAPRKGEKKDDPSSSGTLIEISALESEWSVAKLEEVAREEFSKLIDPFVSKKRYPIKLSFNGQSVLIPRIDKLLLESAHAQGNAEFYKDQGGRPTLSGKIVYKIRGEREKFFRINEADLISIIDKLHPSVLDALGPFEVEFYWFNRRILSAVEGIGDRELVKKLQAQWAGGLMVYRDGFRVNPYGGADDDWLKLDPKALGAAGYKVNRSQIIGRVLISSYRNPRLVDQTNREGLRSCPEKDAIVELLRYLLTVEFRKFITKVDKENKARDLADLSELQSRIDEQESKIEHIINELLARYPDLNEHEDIVDEIRIIGATSKSLLEDVKKHTENIDDERLKLVNLAGLGLMVEFIAHELSRSTAHALEVLKSTDERTLSDTHKGLMSTLRAQLKSIHKRLQVLDPLSTSGRQRKETFDLVELVEEVINSHEGQFIRHGIHASISVKPDGSPKRVRVAAVRGMIIQVLENLITNSVYWLRQKKKLKSSFNPKIWIEVDASRKDIRFTDNGPGVDRSITEEIFEPFVSYKPPGEGKGLGLYISREIARYHKGDLYMEVSTQTSLRLNTFVFTLEPKAK